MKISIKDDTNKHDIVDAINKEFVGTRFTMDIEAKNSIVNIKNIRLKESKEYCGNHPNACEIQVVGRKNRKAKFLEGADWVEFNDRLNDVLDRLYVNANVNSAICNIRIGYDRRVQYDSHWNFNQWEWDRNGFPNHYESWTHGERAPSSIYPEGTPGSYER